MKSKRKHIRNFAFALALCGALSISGGTKTSSLVPYTEEDLKNTQAFETTLSELRETDEIEFENQELYEILCGAIGNRLTPKHLRDIRRLEINSNLQDYNLADLKYLTNLNTLILHNAIVDLSDLKYNQSLKKIKMDNCTVRNTHELPNSIETLNMNDTIVKDDLLYLPYDLSYLSLRTVGFTNLKPKNPEKLREIKIDSRISKIDLSFLEGCNNLTNLTIKYCPNVLRPEYLKGIPTTCQIEFDDYAPIWLTKDVYSSLKRVKSDTNILQEIESLDKIANELVPDKNVSEADKLTSISSFILRNFTYSKDVSQGTERKDEVLDALNTYPIKYALDLDDDFDEICVNYACLFQALANRVGINSTQLISKTHTWNLVNSDYFDLTSLDTRIFTFKGDDTEYTIEELLWLGNIVFQEKDFLGDFIGESFEEVYHFHQQFYVDNNIGYVKSKDKIDEVGKTILDVSGNLLMSLIFIALLGKIKLLYEEHRYRKLEAEIQERMENIARHR